MAKFGTEKDILVKIKEVIAAHTRDSENSIRAEFKDGKVSLWGMVDRKAAKDIIAERIGRIEEVKEIDNSVTVVLDDKINDRDIEEEVLKRFAASHYQGIPDLGCRVNRGFVTLLGHVESQGEVQKARQIATQIQGVKEVRSEIQMSEKVDDATLVNRVEDAFVDSPWVNAHEIKTSARQGTVTLSGLVDRPEEIEWAVDTAYQVHGVSAVVSEIAARHHSQGEDFQLTEQLVGELGSHGINSGQVKAYVEEGIAFLSGQVYSTEERDKAEELVRKMPQISGINNGIQVYLHTID